MVGQAGPGPVIADLKQYAIGADTNGGPRVTVYNPDGAVKFNFLTYDPNLDVIVPDYFAFEESFRGGVFVA